MCSVVAGVRSQCVTLVKRHVTLVRESGSVMALAADPASHTPYSVISVSKKWR